MYFLTWTFLLRLTQSTSAELKRQHSRALHHTSTLYVNQATGPFRISWRSLEQTLDTALTCLLCLHTPKGDPLTTKSRRHLKELHQHILMVVSACNSTIMSNLFNRQMQIQISNLLILYRIEIANYPTTVVLYPAWNVNSGVEGYLIKAFSELRHYYLALVSSFNF